MRRRKSKTCACGQPMDRESKRCKACAEGKTPGSTNLVLPESFESNGDNAVQTRVVDARIKTLDDLIRVFEIDTNIWEVERFIANKWEMGSVNKQTGETNPPVELYQVKAWLKAKTLREKTLVKLAASLLEDIREEVRSAPAIIIPKFDDKGEWLFEFSPFDLHMGKLAWADETVTHYDINIASDLFNASLDFLLERALRLTNGRLDRALCVFGNDVSHIDSKRAQTTSGTPMDVDSRFIRLVRRAAKVHRRAIDKLRQVAPVDVVIVPGNHDELTSFWLGEILATRYEDDKFVTVENGPKLRKYYEYGTNLFGFTHGDAERVAELPLTMAREVPEMWARCESREWHIGHKHISEKFEAKQSPGKLEQDLFSDKGVRIRRLTSLSAHDAWHTKHAYMDRRACEGFVFHKTAGFTDHLSFNVDHFTGKGLETP